jgi:hypothetical protein
MKKFSSLIVCLTIAGCLSAANASAQVATIDGATGMVTIDGTGYVGIDLNSSEGALIAANANAGPAGTTFDVALAPNNLAWLNFGGFPNPFNLGNVLPPGLLTNPGVTIGFVGSDFQTRPGEIVFVPVPEPSTMLMAGLGVLGLAFRRRRVA